MPIWGFVYLFVDFPVVYLMLYAHLYGTQIIDMEVYNNIFCALGSYCQQKIIWLFAVLHITDYFTDCHWEGGMRME